MVGDILQPTHLLFVLVVALLVLGPKRLPEVAKTLGNGLRDFRSAISGESDRARDEPQSFLPQENAQGHYVEDTPEPAATPGTQVAEPPLSAPATPPAAVTEPAQPVATTAPPPVADAHPAAPAAPPVAEHSPTVPEPAPAGAEHSPTVPEPAPAAPEPAPVAAPEREH